MLLYSLTVVGCVTGGDSDSASAAPSSELGVDSLSLAREAANRCAMELGSGDYTIAIDSCTESIEYDPQASIGYHTRALVYYRMNDFRSALADFDQALNVPDRFSSHVLGDDWQQGDLLHKRGHTKLNLGDTYGACQDFGRSIQLGYTEAQDSYDRTC